MKLIKPKQISGEIMTLIEEADKKMIIVSPYYNISNWDKLLNPLNKLKKNRIEVEFYVREGETKSIAEVAQAGFKTIPIKNLHTKLYLNEKEAIVSSMNLNSSSDNHSLDIALKTENKDEYAEIFEYYERYIKREAISSQQVNQPTYYNWKEELDKRLEEILKRDVYVRTHKDGIQINTANRYDAFISNEFSSELLISGIISNKEYEFAKHNNMPKIGNLKIWVRQGNSEEYDAIWGKMTGLNSRSIHHLQKAEEEIVVDTIYRFIVGVEELKKKVR